MSGRMRRSGVEALGEIPWGTHICQFYETPGDLLEMLTGYFRQGLEDNEFCVWVTCAPLGVEEARSALRQIVPDLDERARRGQIEILDYRRLYLSDDRFDADRVLQVCLEKQQTALARGYDGLRGSGNLSWLDKDDWKTCVHYEGAIHNAIASQRMLVLCSYSYNQCRAEQMLDVLRHHPLALVRRENTWEVVQSPRQRKIEESLRFSKERLNLTTEAAQIGTWDWDLRADTLWSDERSRQLLGMRASSASSYETFLNSIHPEDVESVKSRIQVAIDQQQDYSSEFRVVHEDGDARWLFARGQVFFDESGNAQRLLGAVIDITERKRVEEALRESEERFSTIFRTSPICIGFSRGTDGPFVDVNEAFCRMFGYSREEVVGRTSLELGIWSNPEERVKLGALLREQGCVRQREIRFRRKSGEMGFLLFSADLIELAGQQHLLGVLMDITDRKRVEQEKLELERQLLHAQKLESLGVLAGGIAHDFNNILAGIMGYTDLALVRLPACEPVRADLEVIKKAARRAADLTKQMLAYSGKGRFIVEPVNLSRLVEDSKPMLAMSVSKKATVAYKLASVLPDVQADAAQVCQVVMNLVINASEALDEHAGAIAVSTNAIWCNTRDLTGMILGRDLPEGLYVCFEVADTGCGMEEQTLAKIFDPFFTTRFTGRGLGLAAVHGIVRGHKGAIRVASVRGKGTTFQVFFPASGSPIPAVRSEPAARSGCTSGTVLIVDDEETVRTLATQMIERSGFSALAASGGREAIRLFCDHQRAVGCVLLDLTMPDLDGVETLRELRRIRPDVPVILTSGYGEEAATERFVGQGLSGFLQKPYRLDALVARIQDALAGEKVP